MNILRQQSRLSLIACLLVVLQAGCGKDDLEPFATEAADVEWAVFVPTYPPPPKEPPASFLYLLLRAEQKLSRHKGEGELSQEQIETILRQTAVEVMEEAIAGEFVERPDRVTPEFTTVLMEVLRDRKEPARHEPGPPERVLVSAELAADRARVLELTLAADDLMRKRGITDRVSSTPLSMVLDILTSDEVPVEDRKALLKWLASLLDRSGETPASETTDSTPRD